MNRGYINGVILNPKSEASEKIVAYASDIVSKYSDIMLYFDPQFFVECLQGDINLGKLTSYPYFKTHLTKANLSITSNIHTYAKETVDFQQEMSLSAIISPTVSIDVFNVRESQIALSLAYEF